MPRKAKGKGKQKEAFEKHPPGFVPPKYKQMPLTHFLKPASMDIMPTGRNRGLPKKPPPGRPSINKFLVRSKNSEETEDMATLVSKEKENEKVDTATLVAFL